MAEQLETLVRFVRELQREGIDPGPARSRTYCEAVPLLPPEDLYLAGRASLLSRPDQLPGYDRAFRRFFGLGRLVNPVEPSEPAAGPAGAEGGGHEDVDPVELDGPVTLGDEGASAIAVLREKSFADCTEGELQQLAELLVELASNLPTRRTRRYRRSRGGEPDVRRLARSVSRTWGEPVSLPRRRRLTEPRPLLVLVDVSGSMKLHVRGALLLARAALGANAASDVYAFGTSLTRLTDELRASSVDAALAAAATAVKDWEGGTRIGASLRQLLADRQLLGRMRGGIAIVISDGFDTGDPEDLRGAVERLSRCVHRLVWLNPLAADPRYEPLARGMTAALPYVDRFASGHNLRNLQELDLDGQRSARL